MYGFLVHDQVLRVNHYIDFGRDPTLPSRCEGCTILDEGLGAAMEQHLARVVLPGQAPV